MPGGHHLGLWQRESTDFREERDAGRAEESGGEGDLGGGPVTMYVLYHFLPGSMAQTGRCWSEVTTAVRRQSRVAEPKKAANGAGAIPNVYPLYTQGRTLISIGVLPGYDLTHEAAFAKLLWLVSRTDLSFAQRQELFETPVAGEMTVEL